MDILNDSDKQDAMKEWEGERRRGKIFGGIFIVIIGVLFLIRELGVMIPEWLFTWQMLLIAIGVFSGFKHSFKNISWIILILIGFAFLLKEFAPWFHLGKFVWPVAIILVGVYIIFKPRRTNCDGRMKWRTYHDKYATGETSRAGEDYMDFSAVFGSIQKKIISKTFRGGEVNAVFGGAEINLMQADFQGTIELEINTVFGGTRLIIPPNWNIKSEIAAVMGSVEDNRPVSSETQADQDKVLILRGNAVFGGIEIQSY